MVKPKASLGSVLKAVVSLGEQVAELPTKNDVERMIERAFSTNGQLKKIDEIVREVKIISKAVDKDAEAVFQHDKRISRIEARLTIK